MLIELEITGLVESRIRISGTVSSAATGAGLARRLILYNRNRVALAETTSDADGRGSFEVNGNRNDLADQIGRASCRERV